MSKQIHQQFAITGMTCQACANRIEKVLNKKPAINKATVNFATETLQVDYQADATSSDEIIAWVQKTGFEATIDKPKVDTRVPWQLWVLFVLALPFMVGMIGMMMGRHDLMMPVWAQFVLATIVQVVFGARFYQGAWASVRAGLANMDVLVAIGTTAIWAYSTYIWLTDPHAMHGVYFEASVMVIAFVRLGKFLEHRTKTQSLDSIELLTQLIPSMVHKKVADGFVKVGIESVAVGDELLANTGDKIAVDGMVVTGGALANEAHLTGESMLVPKAIGDTVYAGSTLGDGSVVYRAAATGQVTKLGDMMSALADAQGSKADIARFADRVSAVFVPVVVAISIITFVVNFGFGLGFDTSLMRAVAVLVIACPCALGLATPAAIMAGMGVGARHGVWYKDAVSLERAGRIDTIVFDKTGTLTTGKPSVTAMQIINHRYHADELLSIAASLEQYAAHPLAHAIISHAQDRRLPLYTALDVSTVTGSGLMGQIAGVGRVRVGTPSFVGIDEQALAGLDTDWQEKSAASTLVAVSIDDKPAAIFVLDDTIKDEAARIITALQGAGVQTVLMSGDRNSAVAKVANALNITHATGQMSPRDKLSAIERLAADGYQVAMVGDGVNDAPAMAAAQASFAVGGATDVARHTASATLLGESLSHVYYAYHIAQRTLAAIKQNLFFALIYNCIGIPLAALGLLSPAMAAAAMALSSISVLLNAIRLKRLDLTTKL
ncbi:cation-translocating P-type ATPase [Moraxella sp. FZFQ2102]|uniref:heavy metal translocating P-type ATPase n=1 Tax=Moraxella sp. FZFQ2102 TaxID=2953752 RepID=UPI00209BE2A9|nr:cation-translocating P-type ATPase [Moraxella sp. FZFQ2102]USZ14508.1 cation-translocating P-type ATPase [Moraxella sp. FZFQ2102]